MREVAIVGSGITKFGELWDKSFRSIGIEAGIKAIEDAGMSGSEVDGIYIGNMSSRFINQQHIDALIADYSGLATRNVSAVRTEAGGASGGVAFRQGVMAIASGENDVVLVGGAEKMTDLDDAGIALIMDSTADAEWEVSMGLTLSSLYAMIARRLIYDGVMTREEIAAFAVNAHNHGALNPNAQYQRPIKLETVLGSGPVAEPLNVFDCAPYSDGAAAVVLVPLEHAKKMGADYVKVSATAQASDTLALFQREDITTFKATTVAAKEAFKKAGIQPKDIDVAEVHDDYTVAGVMALQDLGLFKRGEAGKAVLEGKIGLGNDLAVNTSGGLKAAGYPVGAAGVAQVVEITNQLRKKANSRQVADARYGLAQSVGGTGSAVTVTILEAM